MDATSTAGFVKQLSAAWSDYKAVLSIADQHFAEKVPFAKAQNLFREVVLLDKKVRERIVYVMIELIGVEASDGMSSHDPDADFTV